MLHIFLKLHFEPLVVDVKQCLCLQTFIRHLNGLNSVFTLNSNKKKLSLIIETPTGVIVLLIMRLFQNSLMFTTCTHKIVQWTAQRPGMYDPPHSFTRIYDISRSSQFQWIKWVVAITHESAYSNIMKVHKRATSEWWREIASLLNCKWWRWCELQSREGN